MKILAIESSSAVAGAALTDGDQLVYEAYSHHKRNHSQILMPLVESVLAAAELPLSQVDIFAVTIGPGSFTGLRIGISTVKGLAMAWDRPVAPIPTLELLAFQLPYASGCVAPILDARRDQVYTGLFAWEGEALKQLQGAQALPIEMWTDKLGIYPGTILFTGDGVPVFRNHIVGALGSKARFAPAHLRLQRASAAAVLAADYSRQGKCVQSSDLMPFYLRMSQAEQRRENQGEGCRT